MTVAPAPCGARQARLVDRAFAGTLPAWRRRRLRRHLAACAGCRARYDRLAAVERAITGAPIAAAAIDDVAHAVVGAAAPRGRRRAVWAGVGAAVAAAAVLIAITTRPDPERPALRARGGPALSGDRMPGLRLFCVDPTRGPAHVVAESRAVAAGPPPTLRCTLDAELQLAYSTPDLGGLTMVAFGLGERSTRYYAPRSADAAAVPLAPDRIDEPLPWSTRLGVKHEVGTYDVIVRFFDRDVTAGAAAAGQVAPVAELRARLEIAPGGRDGR